MESLAKFCEEATGLIVKAMEMAAPRFPRSTLDSNWLHCHPRTNARFLSPSCHEPCVFIRRPNPQDRELTPRVLIEVPFTPPSPPSETETPKWSEGREEWNLQFSTPCDLSLPLPDSHFQDLWGWGLRLFERNGSAVSDLNQALQRHSTKWYEVAAIAYLEVVKAILNIVVKAQSNAAIVTYFTAKFALHAVLNEFTYPALVALQCMSQHARQGVFLAKVVESASSLSKDVPEVYECLCTEILHDRIPRIREKVEGCKLLMRENKSR